MYAPVSEVDRPFSITITIIVIICTTYIYIYIYFWKCIWVFQTEVVLLCVTYLAKTCAWKLPPVTFIRLHLVHSANFLWPSHYQVAQGWQCIRAVSYAWSTLMQTQVGSSSWSMRSYFFLCVCRWPVSAVPHPLPACSLWSIVRRSAFYMHRW